MLKIKLKQRVFNTYKKRHSWVKFLITSPTRSNTSHYSVGVLLNIQQAPEACDVELHLFQGN